MSIYGVTTNLEEQSMIGQEGQVAVSQVGSQIDSGFGFQHAQTPQAVAPTQYSMSPVTQEEIDQARDLLAGWGNDMSLYPDEKIRSMLEERRAIYSGHQVWASAMHADPLWRAMEGKIPTTRWVKGTPLSERQMRGDLAPPRPTTSRE